MLYSDEQKGIYALYSKSMANMSWRIDLLPPMNGVGQTQIFPFWWAKGRRFWVGETLGGYDQTFWIIKSLLAWCKMDTFFLNCKEFIGLMHVEPGSQHLNCISNMQHLHGFLSTFQWVWLWCNCAYWLFCPQIFNDFTNVIRNSWKTL